MGRALLIVGMAAVVAGVFFIVSNKNRNNEPNNTISNVNQGENHMDKSGETIVAYHSAQNHARSVTTKIAGNLGANIFEIVPEQVYTEDDLSWNNSNSRVSREDNKTEICTINYASIYSFDDATCKAIQFWGCVLWLGLFIYFLFLSRTYSFFLDSHVLRFVRQAKGTRYNFFLVHDSRFFLARFHQQTLPILPHKN